MISTSIAIRRHVRRGLAIGGVGIALATTTGTASAAGAGSASVANDTLTVGAGRGADRLALRLQAGAPGVLQVDFGDDGSAEHSFDRSTFSRIEVSMGSGNDQFRIDQANGAFADEAVTVDGRSGDDVLTGGDGAELFIGGSGNDTIDGNRGDDTGVLGAGTDTFRWDPGDGSDVVEGNGGFDTLDFNGAGANENMSLSPNGERSLFVRDVGNIRMDLDDVERLDLTALGGVDTVTVNDMSGTGFRRADVDLSAPTGGGDLQSDLVVVNGTAGPDRIDVSTARGQVDVDGLQTGVGITGGEIIDTLQVNGLDGDDRIDVDARVANVIGTAVDLGAGES